MFRPPFLLPLLFLLAPLVLIVPTAHLWMPGAQVHNAAHIVAPEAALASTFIYTNEAYLMCQQFVRQRLGAQTSAKLPSLRDVSMFKPADYLTVTGYVDVQKSLGEPTRSRYTCNVKPAPGEQWQLVSLHLPR